MTIPPITATQSPALYLQKYGRAERVHYTLDKVVTLCNRAIKRKNYCSGNPAHVTCPHCKATMKQKGII